MPNTITAHQWTAIVNPTAGAGIANKHWPTLSNYLSDQGLHFDTVMTTGPGDATLKATQALKRGSQGLLIVGGDGTISEVVNGCFEENRPILPDIHLGIISCGTGSDFIKSANIPKDTRDAMACFLTGHTSSIDAGKITAQDQSTRYFINIADAGIGGTIVDRVNHSSKILGGFVSFLWSTLVVFGTYQNQKTTIQIDDQIEITGLTNNVIVANGQYFGGGMQILPDARLDDGLFDILILGDFTRTEAYTNIFSVYRGTHLKHPKVSHFTGKKVKVSSLNPVLLDVDGEQWGTTPAVFEILPKCFQLIVQKR